MWLLEDTNLRDRERDGRIALILFIEKIGFKNRKWMGVAQDHVLWRALVLALFNFGFCYQGVDLYKNYAELLQIAEF
jgi:hypothetical protein